jgi:hypothetical protein
MKNWGPYFWGVLHLSALTSPAYLTPQYLDAFLSLVLVYTMILPCPACRIHFSQLLAELPPIQSIKTGLELFVWTVDAHNSVNKRIDKRQYSVEEAYKYWLERSGYDEPKPPTVELALLFALLLLISFLVLK